MMQNNPVRIGDGLENGGQVTDGSSTMSFIGRALARKGDPALCAKPDGIGFVIAAGGDFVLGHGMEFSRTVGYWVDGATDEPFGRVAATARVKQLWCNQWSSGPLSSVYGRAFRVDGQDQFPRADGALKDLPDW